MVKTITKRDGRVVPFDDDKIFKAIDCAVEATVGEPRRGRQQRIDKAKSLAVERANKLFTTGDNVTVEKIQDIVEESLMDANLHKVAKCYILYRSERTSKREMGSSLMQTLHDLTIVDSEDFNLKRENANIDGDTAMGTMLRYGSEASKAFVDKFILEPDMVEAHRNGDIHIHDKDFYMLTETCCQIDLEKLLNGGFSTGHGVLREPNDIRAYSALAAIAIQANQNDMHRRSIA